MRTADEKAVQWNLVQPGSPAAPKARHRAPEPDEAEEPTDTDGLADTVAVSALSLSYGRHAASTAGLPELWSATGVRAVPHADDAAVAEPDAGVGVFGQRRAVGRMARMFAGHVRPWPRSA